MLNIFKQRKAFYQAIGNKEFSETDSEVGEGPSDVFFRSKDDSESFVAHSRCRSHHSATKSCCCTILLAIISLLVGLLTGQFLRAEYIADGFIGPYTSSSSSRNVENVMWSLNETFAGVPSTANEEAWSSLMPFGRGFVVHPAITNGETKALSTFHQLHCLYGLHTAYYAQTNKLDKIQHQIDPSHNYIKNAYLDGMSEHELGLHHVKHCFEYIRQSIMCSVDTNLEPVSISPKGSVVTEPWEAKRMCRNWDEVVSWAEKWRAGDGLGIVG